MKRFNGKWQKVLLEDILDYEQPGKYIVKSTNYLQKGIPVLTAGKSLILGYTNEFNNVYDKGEVIIFDDFLTTSKYINYPFKIKSSAIKLLTKKRNDDSLSFIYYKMQDIDFLAYEHKRYWISEYSKISIELPIDIEQHAIARVLSNVDNLIEDYEKLIAKKEKMKQGLMQNLLTGKKRLKGFNKEWGRKELKQFGNIITGTTPSRNNNQYWNGNINWITAQDFKGKYIDSSVEKITIEGSNICRMLPKNTVIVTCIASIGLNAIIKKESATNQQINGIICNEEIDNEFVYYLLSYYNSYIKSFASQTAVPIISKSIFEEIGFLIPVEKREQQAISQVLSNADNEINDLIIKLNKIINIKKGMLDNLLTGKIRL